MQAGNSTAMRRRPCCSVRARSAALRAGQPLRPARSLNQQQALRREPLEAEALPVASVLRLVQAASLAASAALTSMALLVAAAPAAYAEPGLGSQVFNGNCAACHLGGKNSVIADRTLDKAALEAYLDGGYTLDAIITQVNNGKGAMPAWADRLDEDEIKAVAEYVLAQSTVSGWGNNS